jgi:hypothetical protein
MFSLCGTSLADSGAELSQANVGRRFPMRTRLDSSSAWLSCSRQDNAKFQASEANGVINRYRGLGETQKQDLLNFLRSL